MWDPQGHSSWGCGDGHSSVYFPSCSSSALACQSLVCPPGKGLLPPRPPAVAGEADAGGTWARRSGCLGDVGTVSPEAAWRWFYFGCFAEQLAMVPDAAWGGEEGRAQRILPAHLRTDAFYSCSSPEGQARVMGAMPAPEGTTSSAAVLGHSLQPLTHSGAWEGGPCAWRGAAGDSSPVVVVYPRLAAPGGCCGCVVLIRTDDGFMEFQVRPPALPVFPGEVQPRHVQTLGPSRGVLWLRGTSHSCGIRAFSPQTKPGVGLRLL